MEVRFSRSAGWAIRRSNKRDLIRAKINAVADNPLATNPNVTRLRGRPEFRLRVQDWRVIFRIEGDVLIVDEAGPRGSVYEDRT